VKSSLGGTGKVMSIVRGVNRHRHGAAQQVNKLAVAGASCRIIVSCAFMCEASLHMSVAAAHRPETNGGTGLNAWDSLRLHKPHSAANIKLLLHVVLCRVAKCTSIRKRLIDGEEVKGGRKKM
jgi:hypothetical protein